MTTAILVVDDDPKIRLMLRRSLLADGYAVYEAYDMSSTLNVLRDHTISLVTLDLNLGSEDGIDVAREIRRTLDVPIIMLTAKNDVIDRVVGLEIGADDYIVKPFHLREVTARIKSVLRRSQVSDTRPKVPSKPDGYALMFDNMLAIPDKMELRDRQGHTIEMTSGEFKLLEVFLNRPKRVLSREQLMDLMGGPSYAPLDRTIDNQIARLRKKIERDTERPSIISTVRGIGYSFTCDVETVGVPVS